MKFPKIEECYKGDICTIEICIERSSANKAGITVRMWKREDDKFQVECYDENKIGDDRFFDKRKFAPDEANAREAYEKCCDDNGCSPYPEAEAYYRRKGLLKDSA